MKKALLLLLLMTSFAAQSQEYFYQKYTEAYMGPGDNLEKSEVNTTVEFNVNNKSEIYFNIGSDIQSRHVRLTDVKESTNDAGEDFLYFRTRDIKEGTEWIIHLYQNYLVMVNDSYTIILRK